MSEKTLKILVSGSTKGQYAKLFKRVSDVNNKAGPFDLLLCVGDFFGDDFEAYKELINGSTDLPNVPTYVLGRIPHRLLEFHPNIENFDQGCELTDNLTFLGRAGILTTTLGLRIAYLNGSYDESKNIEQDKDINHFTDKEFESLVMSCQSSNDVVDILLTTEWPTQLFNHLSEVDQTIQTIGDKSSSLKISQLCNELRPRYHFVGGSNVFYERLPYRNHRVLNEASRNVTRFYSIADVANTKKMKWIYAFNIIPSKYLPVSELNSQPNGTTENPFRSIILEKKEKDLIKQDQSNQFRYDLTNRQEQEIDGDRHGNRKRKKNDEESRRPRKEVKINLENCWFCLASPNVDKSLIVSIGDHSYLALAKGGLTDDHMLILPIEHIRSTIEIQNGELRDEIEKYKNALTGFFQQRQMVPVFFERNFKCPHFQIQVIGLPEKNVSSLKEAVEEVFQKFEYHEMGLQDELEDVLAPGVPYFYFECYNHFKFFVRINTKKEFFPIQIGRELMAHRLLLNCPERIDWKYCDANKKETEAELTQNIRKIFKKFDFTILD